MEELFPAHIFTARYIQFVKLRIINPFDLLEFVHFFRMNDRDADTLSTCTACTATSVCVNFHVTLRAVRVTAESLFVNAPVHSANDAGRLGGLAALVGDDARAARYAEQSAALTAFNSPLPKEVLTLSRVLLAYAASGGPIDSLTKVEARLRRAIVNGVVPSRQSFVTGNLLGRAAAIAFPVKRLASLAGIDSSGDYLIAAERQFAAGHYADVRTTLADVGKSTPPVNSSSACMPA